MARPQEGEGVNVNEAVRTYHETGYSVAALAPGKKQPWRDVKPSAIRTRPQTAEDLARLFAGKADANIGILTGACSGDLAVLDVDSLAFWAILDRYPIIRRLKAVSAVVPTRRGYHLYMRLPWPARGAVLGKFRADFKGEGGLVVAPPSVVRKEHGESQLYFWAGDGFRPAYRLTAPELADLVELLGVRSVFDVVPGTEPDMSADLTGTFYGLGRAAWAALRNPDPKGDRSVAEQGAILRAVSIGFTFADTRELFRRHAAPGTKYADKEREGYADRWLEGSYIRAVDFAARTMTPYMADVNAALRVLEGQESPFTGRAKWTDAAVYSVVLQVVRETGREWIRASARGIADRTGIAPSKYMNALDRLCIAGALRVRKEPDGLYVCPEHGYMSGYLFAKGNSLTHSLGNPLPGDSRGTGLGSLGVVLTRPPEAVAPPAPRRITHDAHRYRALGPSGPALVQAINARKGEPFTVADLTGTLPYYTVNRKLDLMVRAGVVELAGTRKVGGWRPSVLYRAGRIGFPELDRIAQAAGTAGAGERQRKRHEAERRADSGRNPFRPVS